MSQIDGFVITAKPAVHVGPGAIGELPGIVRAAGADQVVVVTDEALATAPVIETVLTVLADAGLPARLFAGVHPVPTPADLAAGAERRGRRRPPTPPPRPPRPRPPRPSPPCSGPPPPSRAVPPLRPPPRAPAPRAVPAVRPHPVSPSDRRRAVPPSGPHPGSTFRAPQPSGPHPVLRPSAPFDEPPRHPAPSPFRSPASPSLGPHRVLDPSTAPSGPGRAADRAGGGRRRGADRRGQGHRDRRGQPAARPGPGLPPRRRRCPRCRSWPCRPRPGRAPRPAPSAWSPIRPTAVRSPWATPARCRPPRSSTRT